MLSDREDDPLLLVVAAPHVTFMLEAETSRLGRRVDAPLVKEKECLDGSSIAEGGDRLFEEGSCCKR